MAPILKKVFKHRFSLLFAIKITSLYPLLNTNPTKPRRGSKFCFDPPPGIDIEERKLLVASIEQVGCYPLTIPTQETLLPLPLDDKISYDPPISICSIPVWSHQSSPRHAHSLTQAFASKRLTLKEGLRWDPALPGSLGNTPFS